MTNSEIEILDDPVKSESDKKDYRLFRINKNKLTVLVVSHAKLLADDQKSEEDGERLAAASISVDVGSFHDTETGILGMAHFVEHMAFMGSEKYPEENAYNKYIKLHGGFANAYTECEYTNFYFSVVEKGFEGALDIFSNMFVAPLMSKDSMNREREAVESEFQKGINKDGIRIEQLLRSIGSPGHPSNIFPYGNLKTLKDNISDDDLYERAHKFLRKHYVANKMYLCLQSKMSLDELQDLAIKYFADIPFSAQIDPPLSANSDYSYLNAFKPEFHEKVFYVKPKSDQTKLFLNWALPSMLENYYCKPHDLLSHILGHEGSGSFCSYLRKKLLAVDVVAGAVDSTYHSNSIFMLYTISITLTDHGAQNIDKVLEAVFAYLLLLQKDASCYQDIFTENKLIRETYFRFRTETGSTNKVVESTKNMKFYPPKDIFTGPQLYFEYNHEQIMSVIDALNNTKFNLLILTKDHEFNKTEQWYGTEYAEVDFPENFKNVWMSRRIMDEFYLPEKNQFICNDFRIIHEPKNEEKTSKYPEKIFENDFCECWYRLDDKFLLPKAVIFIRMVSPVPLKSTYNNALMRLFSSLMSHYLAEILYPASIAGLHINLMDSVRGMSLYITGYNEKLYLMADIVMEKVMDFCNILEESAFETYKKQLKKDCYNSYLEPDKLSYELITNLISKDSFLSLDIHKIVDQITIDDLKEFALVWMKELHVQVLMQGNLGKEHSMEIVKNILKKLNCREIEDKSIVEERSRKIPPGQNYLKVKSLQPGNKNSITTNYYQMGEKSIKLECLLELFNLIQKEPLFDTLRTQQQLGYVVYGYSDDCNNLLGLVITVMSQEDRNPTIKVEQRIEEFLMEKVPKILEEMSEEEFQTTKQSLIKLKKVVDSHLYSEFRRNYLEILSKDYLFDRNERCVKFLSNLKKSDIVDFYDKFFKNPNLQKLSVQVVGNTEELKPGEKLDDIDVTRQLEILTDKTNDQQNIITDMAEFKNSLYLYPVLTTKLD